MFNPKEPLSGLAVEVMRRRARIIQLLDAAERVGIAPLRAARLHAFVYLADVLSPVWNLPSFDGKVLKIDGGPHYPDLQRELDRMVALGLLQIGSFQYVPRKNIAARIDGLYSLNLDAPELDAILAALGTRDPAIALDPKDCEIHSFMVDLAGALSTVPDEEIDVAASLDATYSDERIGFANIVDFGSWTDDASVDNLSFRTVKQFNKFLPQGTCLAKGEKLYLYASFLGRRVHGR